MNALSCMEIGVWLKACQAIHKPYANQIGRCDPAAASVRIPNRLRRCASHLARRETAAARHGWREMLRKQRTLGQSVHGKLYICSYRRAVLESTMRKLGSKVKPGPSPLSRVEPPAPASVSLSADNVLLVPSKCTSLSITPPWTVLGSIKRAQSNSQFSLARSIREECQSVPNCAINMPEHSLVHVT